VRRFHARTKYSHSNRRWDGADDRWGDRRRSGVGERISPHRLGPHGDPSVGSVLRPADQLAWLRDRLAGVSTGAGAATDRAGTPILCADRAVSHDPDTYTVYLVAGNACIDTTVDHYLVDGVLPGGDATCTAAPDSAGRH
jgi:hypothetical protein